MSPLISSFSDLSSDYNANTIEFVFVVVSCLSFITVLVMCCSGKKKEKEANHPATEKKATKSTSSPDRTIEFELKAKVDKSNERSFKPNKETSVKFAGSQFSKMGLFRMQSMQMQGGKNRSYARGPQGTGSILESPDLKLMTIWKKDPFDDQSQTFKEKSKSVRKKDIAKDTKSIKEKLKYVEVSPPKEDKKLPRHMRPESTHYNIPQLMDM